jgi:hypothetical protein
MAAALFRVCQVVLFVRLDFLNEATGKAHVGILCRDTSVV